MNHKDHKMTTTSINQNKTLATVLHLSVFTQFFIPLGNFIFPTLLWLSRKQDPFVDHHGRNALNFQISIFLYSVFLLAAGVVTCIYFGLKIGFSEPFYINHEHIMLGNVGEALPFIIIAAILGIIFLGLFILELFAVITASIRASEGQEYKYPLTINFISSAKPEENNRQSNQSKNEQF